MNNEHSKFLLRKDCNVTQLKMPLAGCVSFYDLEVKSFAIKCKDEVDTKLLLEFLEILENTYLGKI